MKMSEAFPSNYLKAQELPEEDHVLTIDHVETESIGQGKDAEEKPVLYFKEEQRGLVLNKTNSTTIASMYGDESDGWAGKRVALFATEVDFQGKQVLAIRVRMRRPGGVQRPGQPAARAKQPVPAAAADEEVYPEPDDLPI